VPYCPQCRSEYRSGWGRCEDCDLDLVETRPERPPPENWTEVFRGSAARANAVCGALEAAGIETLSPDDFAPDLGAYAPSAIGMIRVLVREADLPQALELTTGAHRLEEEAPPVAPTQPVLPRSLPLRTLIARSFLDCFLVAIIPCVVAFPAFGGQHSKGNYFLGILLAEPSLLAVAVWRRRLMVQRGEAVPPPRGPSRTGDLIIGVLAGFSMAVLALLYSKLLAALGGHPGYRGPLWDALDSSTAFVILMSVVVAPICEESFFRGTMLGAFTASGRRGWGILLSSLLFAAGHFNPRMAPLYVLDGLFFAALYREPRTLLCPVVAHTVANAGIVALYMSGGI
jgi:membrane protease YdiL (CAAX protease family)